MAWEAWSSSKWQKVWDNGYYQQEVQWSYRVDRVNRKLEYRAQQWRQKKISSKVTGWWKSSCPIGIATITGNRSTSNHSIDMRTTSYVTVNLTDVSTVVNMDSSGKVTANCYLHSYCDAASTGATGAPSGWHTVSITSQFPTTDVSGGTASASVSSKTYNSITISYTSNVATTLIQYSLNGGAWTDTGKDLGTTGGGTTSFTIGGLSPNTAYTIKVRHRRDYTQTYSNEVSLSATTNKPSAPSGGTVSVSEITHNSAKMTYSGFKAGAGASISRYDVAMRQEPGDTPWVNNGLNTSYIGRGLPPNTYCIARVTAVDNFGQRSAYVDKYFTTLKPAAPTLNSIKATPSLNSISVTANATAGSGASISKYMWRIDSGSWTQGQITQNFSGLNPNTTHTIECYVVDNYSQNSSTKSVTSTTLKPNAPSISGIQIIESNYSSITISITGITYGQGGSFGSAQYRLNNGEWTDMTSVTNFVIESLEGNTQYLIECRVLDNYGTSSNIASVQASTIGLVDSYVKVNGVWKKGIVKYKLNGQWINAARIYKKINGKWYANI